MHLVRLQDEDHFGITWSKYTELDFTSYCHNRRWFIVNPKKRYWTLSFGMELMLESEALSLLFACARELILEKAADTLAPSWRQGLGYIQRPVKELDEEDYKVSLRAYDALIDRLVGANLRNYSERDKYGDVTYHGMSEEDIRNGWTHQTFLDPNDGAFKTVRMSLKDFKSYTKQLSTEILARQQG
jgi:hypothetical protein